MTEGTSDMLELLVERDGTRRPVNRRKFAGHAGHSMLLADLSEIFNDMLCSSTPSNTLRISLCLSSVSLPGAVNVSIFRISRPLQSVGETRLAVTNRIGPDKTHDGNDALSILSNIALLLRSSNRHSIHESLTKVTRQRFALGLARRPATLQRVALVLNCRHNIAHGPSCEPC